MGANSLIEWTWQRVAIHSIDSECYRLALSIGAVQVDATTILVPGYTFNPWIGCTKVDELCANCYAKDLDDRRFSKTLGRGSKESPVSHWGPGAPRHRTSEANWKEVRKWNEIAGRLGIRQRVFCASLADWLDDDGVPIEWLADLLTLIHECQNLDWLLLTKRPQNWRSRVSAASDVIMARGGEDRWLFDWCVFGKAPPNVWIGTSVGHQKSADARIPELLKIPALVRFLSCEPMLGPVDLMLDGECSSWTCRQCGSKNVDTEVEVGPGDVSTYHCHACNYVGGGEDAAWKSDIHWVICGGESGDKARPMHPDWARSLRDQCAAAGVPFLLKQWGEWLPDNQRRFTTSGDITWGLVHESGKFRLVLNEGVRDWKQDTGWNPGEQGTTRVGKSKSGRLLDGIEHNGSPEVRRG